MIDLHTHILAGVDDGARDLGVSLRMLEIAIEDGIETIVATPHCQDFSPSWIQEVRQGVDDLAKRAAERELPIEILSGFEIMLSPDVVELGDDVRSLCINQSRYLLMEMPAQFKPLYADYVIDYLQSAGLRVILAHAERYDYIQRDPQLAAELARRGVLLQVNGASLLGEAGAAEQRCARDLLVRGLVRFLASDAHSARRRVPRLARARTVASRLIGANAADALVIENPRAVVSDDDDLPPAPPISRRSIFRFLPVSWLTFPVRRRGGQG